MRLSRCAVHLWCAGLDRCDLVTSAAGSRIGEAGYAPVQRRRVGQWVICGARIGADEVPTPPRHPPLAFTCPAGNCGLHDLPGYPTCQQQKSETYEETSPTRLLCCCLASSSRRPHGPDSRRAPTGTPSDPWQPHALAYGSGVEDPQHSNYFLEGESGVLISEGIQDEATRE